MRVLLINYEFPPVGGGAGNATYELARALVTLGHAPVVLTARYRGRRSEHVPPGVTLIEVPSRRSRPDRASVGEMASYVFHAIRRVRAVLQQERIDVMWCFFSMPCGPIAWWGARGKRVPFLVLLRGGDVPGMEPGLGWMHAMLGPFRRKILRSAQRVIANSEGLAKAARAVDRVPVEVVPNGVDTEFFCPPLAGRVREGATFTLIFAGRFQPQKNLAWLLAQLAEVMRTSPVELRLELVGDGPLRAELEAQAEALGIGAKISWHGWLSREQLHERLWQADALVNPSLYEGMPNTVLEAMATGLPVLASRVAGNETIVEDGRTGFLFSLGEPRDFREKLLALLADRQAAAELGENARERVMRAHAWTSTAADFVGAQRAENDAEGKNVSDK